jgi:hypothetical protein
MGCGWRYIWDGLVSLKEHVTTYTLCKDRKKDSLG